MYFTYILRSTNYSNQYYYGSTSDVERRLEKHNNGKSYHTSKYKPWKIIFYAAFETRRLAEDFEKYLKNSSGRAFMRKRLIQV
ncbi:MAG: GIY-YIG nuclease family protein [Candidatus Dojkabacteria bacterium]|nr:GIY-YIG nuclease family protein [Candidatus Dojkabacteria bacterium]